MARQKLVRFAALEQMANVIDGRRYPPDWFDDTFGPRSTVTVELGCGRGEYTLALARRYPTRHFLGVDRNGGRLWNGAAAALNEGLSNAAFLRAPIQTIEEHIPAGRVADLWIPFPDPLPKRRQTQHRLVSPFFLERYRGLLAPGGSVHLKTDDAELAAFAERAVCTLGGQLLSASDSTGPAQAATAIQTTYERKYRSQGRTIYERQFLLPVTSGREAGATGAQNAISSPSTRGRS
jgi:tRNA (guanine-N7-)-methyltransferase